MNQHLSPDLLVDYLHGELAPEDDALAHAHLSACAVCRREIDLEANLTEVLKKMAATEEQEMPSLIKAAVWQQIRDAKPSPIARFAAWVRSPVAIPAMGIPAFAVLLVGGWFVSPYGHPGATAPTIDATYYLQAHAQTAQTPLSVQPAQPALETSMIDSGTVPQLADADADAPLAAGGLDGSR
jgi:predicted anti-sigma-YlaC factor YlaD